MSLQPDVSECLSETTKTLESLASGFNGKMLPALAYDCDAKEFGGPEAGVSSLKPKLRYKHNMSHTPTYQSWLNMLKRCYNPKARGYKDYGGRGIRVCRQWRGTNGFWHFWQDMGDRPEGMTLDRLDVNGNYEIANTCWASKSEQQRNRRCRK